MSEQEIEGNKLIAEFMQLSVSVLHGDLCYADWDGMHSVKYHTSWDWLMPVVEKINSMNRMVTINFYTEQKTVECKIYNWEVDAPYQGTESESPIETVWQTVTKFIKWYNQRPQ